LEQKKVKIPDGIGKRIVDALKQQTISTDETPAEDFEYNFNQDDGGDYRMPKMLILTREEFDKIYDQGKEATYALFMSLVSRLEELERRCQEACKRGPLLAPKRGPLLG
jgi:hypothetical protein